MYQSNVDVAVTDQLCNPTVQFAFNEAAPTTIVKNYDKEKVGFELANDGTNPIGIRLRSGNSVVYEKELKPGEVMSKWILSFNKLIIDNLSNEPFRLDVMG